MSKTIWEARESSVRKEERMKAPPLILENWSTLSSRDGRDDVLITASLRIKVGENIVETAAEGKSLVEAVANILKEILRESYPEIKDFAVLSYLIEDGEQGAWAQVKVVAERQNREQHYTLIGFSNNTVDAIWQALTDGFSNSLPEETG